MSATAETIKPSIQPATSARAGEQPLYDAEGSAEANLPAAETTRRRRPSRASARPAAAAADYRVSRAGRRSHTAARGLGWFSIALGLTELIAPYAVARAVGLQGREGLVRLYGLREIATGIGLLTARDPSPWVWGRVAGDALDLATLGSRTHGSDATRTLIGIAAVAGVTAADLAAAKGLHTEAERKRRPVFDYGDRSGFPQGMEAARGAALQSFETPRDMRGPEALRPHSGGADEFEAQKRSRET